MRTGWVPVSNNVWRQGSQTLFETGIRPRHLPTWSLSTMLSMRLLVTLTSLAAMIGMAVPAHADPTDDSFLSTLHAAGMTAQNDDRAIYAGKWVCNMVQLGNPIVDVVKTLQTENPGLTEDKAARFTEIAANVYCPPTPGESHWCPIGELYVCRGESVPGAPDAGGGPAVPGM